MLRTIGEQHIFRLLLEQIVYNLHRIDVTRLESAKHIRWFPCVYAYTDTVNETPPFEILDRPLPLFVFTPVVFPDMELKQIDTFRSQVAQTRFGVVNDVLIRENVFHTISAAGWPCEILWRNLGGEVKTITWSHRRNLTDKLFAMSAPVNPGSIEEITALFDTVTQGRQSLCIGSSLPA